MIATIRPSSISESIPAPASKSAMQRACAAALISTRRSIIHNPGHSNDDKAALRVIAALGAKVTELDNGSIEIDSSAIDLSSPAVGQSGLTVNCGESGLGIRMFSPIIALSRLPVTITGEGSLVSRPMDFFDEILPRLNITIKSNNGKLPITLSGPLQPRNIEIDGSLSSQFLTGLLMAYAAAKARDVTIKVNELRSRPYIDLTLAVMEAFGLKTPENKNYKAFYFDQSPAQIPSAEIVYTVEGDWSGASFLLVAGAIAGKMEISGLNVESTQADRRIMEALVEAGAIVEDTVNGISVRSGSLKAFEFDATDCPDLFPPLVALAAYCEGTTTIQGVSRLAHKESDRGIALQKEFGKMGLQIDLQDDLMLVHGGKGLTGATVHSHHDHRIAMACAVAGLKADGPTTIEDAEAINKSYPDFYDDLCKLGAVIEKK
ncbi:MAG: 3-phosphoshikimate 1-carboxyvinyltransferase [Chitinophagaceae bacterium]|nr:3-phosphoshikimate 1-carboxyvinyltransferase [Chitinophagaceae bacterium]